MPKFLILHNATEPAAEFMAKFTSEEKQAGMQQWMNWKDQAEKTVKFEFGMPIQAVGRVLPNGGITASDNKASGYSFIEADTKEAVFEVLKNHPHLLREGANMDVLEIVPMN